MRWSIVRIIWARELRDQLRDRRTLFMIAVLPILLYPIAGLGFLQLAASYGTAPTVVGIQGREYLPPGDDWVAPEVAAAIGANAPGGGVERVAAAAALDLLQHYPPLLVADGERLRIRAAYLESEKEGNLLVLKEADRRELDERQVDLLLVVPPDFMQRLRDNGRPELDVFTRPDDDRSRLVDNRLKAVLDRWKKQLKEVRFRRQGLPADFDEPFGVRHPAEARSPARQAAEDIYHLLLRIFPFVLVMWSLAGALYPAVDLCAGEKERGTMETLLISPASREEIVWGKFLTIWVFSAVTALLNLLSMGLTTWQFSRKMNVADFRLGPLFWGVLLLLPLSAFFSAICLAVGAYARSSKEGQYYLMPLFLLTMPLIFLTLVPGVTLNAFYSMVPVTGVALLLQRLMAAGLPGPDLWGYFLPVLAPMVLYSWLALRWAIEQFQREEVLFREAERLDLKLWLRRLFREKEALPSGGEALFCFGLILGLQWLTFSIGGRELFTDRSLGRFLNLSIVRYLAFVAAPPLFMAIMLTTRPLSGLGLRLPPWWAWLAAVVLALLLFPPITALTLTILDKFPDLARSIRLPGGGAAAGARPEAEPLAVGGRWAFVAVLGVLPALCEELAFRGFILSGLRRRFRPWTAIFLSSFLFALYQMNVFQFAPHFVFGSVLALLVVRSGSVLPAIVFHLVWNACLLVPTFYPEVFRLFLPGSGGDAEELLRAGWWLVFLCAALAALGLVGLWYLGQVRETGVPEEGRAESLSRPGAGKAKDLTPQAPS
jgi:sodium transport system permease protein